MGNAAEVRGMKVAAGQFGVIHRKQARVAGMSNRQVEYRVLTGDWQRLYPCVYRVAGAPTSWRQQLMAVVLWAEQRCALSHRTAAALWGFARFREGPVELSVTRNLPAPHAATVHKLAALLPSETAVIDGMRVTTPTRTLLDLSAIEDRPTINACLDEALRRRWTTIEKLEMALARATHRRGVDVLRPLVAAIRGGEAPTESELERRVLDFLDAEGFPRPTTQARVFAGDKLRRLDFRFPGTKVVIEADGYASHSSAASFEKDRDRNDALVAHGYRVFHWTWAALRDRPEQLAARLQQALDETSSHPRAQGA